jgi:hypothetical protein
VLAAAGASLVVVRARQQHKKRGATRLRALEKSAHEVSGDIRNRLGR